MGENLSTLIIAAKCKGGVVMAADKRSMRGMEYREETKIHNYYKVVTAFAGLTGLKDKFLEIAEEHLRNARAVNLMEAIAGVEDTMELISNRYKNRLEGAHHIEALLAGLKDLNSGEAKLYHVVGEGYSEEIDFLCIGHGSPYATCLSKNLYKTDLPIENMAEICIFLISWVEGVDGSVGGVPDVVFVKDNEGIGKMNKSEIKQIYERSKEVGEKWGKILPKAIKDPKILDIPPTVKKEEKKEKGKEETPSK